MNLSMKQEKTHRHREEACGCQVGAVEAESWNGRWEQQMRTSICRMDKQHPTVHHRGQYSISYDKT